MACAVLLNTTCSPTTSCIAITTGQSGPNARCPLRAPKAPLPISCKALSRNTQTKSFQSVLHLSGTAVICRHRLVDVGVLHVLIHVHDVCLLVRSATFDIIALRLLSRLLASRTRSKCSSGTLLRRWVFHRVGPHDEAHPRQLGVASFLQLSLQDVSSRESLPKLDHVLHCVFVHGACCGSELAELVLGVIHGHQHASIDPVGDRHLKFWTRTVSQSSAELRCWHSTGGSVCRSQSLDSHVDKIL